MFYKFFLVFLVLMFTSCSQKESKNLIVKNKNIKVKEMKKSNLKKSDYTHNKYQEYRDGMSYKEFKSKLYK